MFALKNNSILVLVDSAMPRYVWLSRWQMADREEEANVHNFSVVNTKRPRDRISIVKSADA